MKINPKIFKEYDIRGEYPWEINEDAAYAISRAFVKFKKAKKVVVARDRRIESQKISVAFIAGLADAGAKIFDLGVDATPALFFAIGFGQFDAGAMVTASHNPDGYTGLKLCGRDGVAIGLENGLKNIELLASQIDDKKKIKTKKSEAGKLSARGGSAFGGEFGKLKIEQLNLLNSYYNFVLSFVDEKKIRPMKLVLDASGGSGAKLADYVFVRLPGRVTKMNFKRHDKYPDHDLNPILPKNHASICREVKKQKANLGIIWDGDGDRSIFIDEQGRFVEPYYLNCLLSRIILQKWPKLKILIDARLSLGLTETIEQNGGRAISHRAGYSNIVRTMKQKKIRFGCENSGHYIFNFLMSPKSKKNFAFGDGIIPALLILEYLSESGEKISQAIKPFKEKYLISGELNFKLKNFEKLRAKILAKYKNNQMAEIDGLSVFGDSYFFNLRSSHTEPLVRLNIEARDRKTLVRLKKELTGIIGK